MRRQTSPCLTRPIHFSSCQAIPDQVMTCQSQTCPAATANPHRAKSCQVSPFPYRLNRRRTIPCVDASGHAQTFPAASRHTVTAALHRAISVGSQPHPISTRLASTRPHLKTTPCLISPQQVRCRLSPPHLYCRSATLHRARPRYGAAIRRASRRLSVKVLTVFLYCQS
jgi:hypothetical protein